MGVHGHGRRALHGAAVPGGEVQIARATTVTLAVLVALIAAATAAGIVAVWPGRVAPSRTSTALQATDTLLAKVVSAQSHLCAGTTEDRLPDGQVPAQVRCLTVKVQLQDGPDKGKVVPVEVGTQLYESGLRPGVKVEVDRIPADALDDMGQPVTADPSQAGAYAFVDFSRTFPLGLLFAGFLVLVVGVGRLRGLAALIGLGLGYLTVLKFMLPALQAGHDATLVALCGSAGIMMVILYLAHGISAKTTTALLGTMAGLSLTAGLAHWAVVSAHLTGLNGDDSLNITQLVGQRTLIGVITCGLILAGLGVLNDVTVTQASAIWELREHAPHLSAARLFGSGMRIGRDHLASTVYTVAFAYAGAALPTVLLIDLYNRPLGQVLTSEGIAEEVVRTLVAGIGLILSIPLTTAVAAIVVTAGRSTVAEPAETANDSMPQPTWAETS